MFSWLLGEVSDRGSTGGKPQKALLRLQGLGVRALFLFFIGGGGGGGRVADESPKLLFFVLVPGCGQALLNATAFEEELHKIKAQSRP